MREKSRQLREFITAPSLMFFVMVVAVLSLQHFILGYESYFKFGLMETFKGFALRAVLDVLIFMLPYWFLQQHFRRWVWLLIAVQTMWCLAQLWYVRTYFDFMSVKSLFLWENVSWLLFDSIIGSMRWVDLGVVLPPLVLYAFYRWKLCVPMKSKSKSRKFDIVAGCCSLVLCVTIFLHEVCAYHMTVLHQSFGESFDCIYLSPLTLKMSYTSSSVITLMYLEVRDLVLKDEPMTATEKREIEKYINNQCEHYQDNTYSSGLRKNLIFIIVESLNSWTIGMKIDGKELTPTMNRLCSSDSVVSVLRVQPQVKAGRSSDAHLMYNTGLLPLVNEPFITYYATAQYPSLARALKGYSTLQIVSDDRSFWSQNFTSTSYGFARISDVLEMNQEMDENHRLEDAALFEKAKKEIARLKSPFFVEMVTLTMHQPYDTALVPATWISNAKGYSDEVLNYMERVHFFDEKLGDFLKYLKTTGVMDSSVVVIASDHDNVNRNELERRLVSTNEDKEIPVFILNTAQTLHYRQIAGQIDIYPTVMDVMGINAYWWKGLGRSIFRNRGAASVAVGSNEMVGEADEAMRTRQQQAWRISEIMLKKGYFRK